MKALLLATLLLAASAATAPAASDAPAGTWGGLLRETLLRQGDLPASALLNGAERPFEEGLALLDRLAAPGTHRATAPTKDFGMGTTHGQPGLCGVGAFVAVYASAPGVATPPPTLEALDVHSVAPVENACWAPVPVFVGSVSGDLAPMAEGGNLAMNSCLYGPGSGFVVEGTVCHGGFGGARPFERFTLAGAGLTVVEFSGCGEGSCWRFTAMQAVPLTGRMTMPGAGVVTLASE